MTGLAAAMKENSAGADRRDQRLAAVRLDGVTIEFKVPDGQNFRAVDATDLIVGEEEFVAIVGPTGAESRHSSMLPPGCSGHRAAAFRFFGEPLAGINKSAGYLFQQDALMPWKTAVDDVAIGLEVAGVRTREAHGRAQTWLGRVGLAAFGDRYPHTLSGGRRKRVALAQVLIEIPRSC